MKPVLDVYVAGLDNDVELFCLENDDEPAGNFPRAFSDMPLNWIGRLSSAADEDTEGVLELPRTDAEDCEGVGPSSLSESSESPIANVSSVGV